MSHGPAGVRRAARWWSVVAFAGIPLVLVMGVWQLTSATDAPARITVERVHAPGEPVPVAGGTAGWTLWGRPADADLAEVTCTYTAPTRDGELPVTGEPVVATDALGGGDFVRLTTTADEWTAQEATCRGGGLEAVARAPQPTPGADRAFGVVLLVMAPVLAALGLVARRAGRSR